MNKYLESGFDVIGNEKKYQSANRFNPKKCPEKQVRRADIKFIYSWIHYAPVAWFELQRKMEEEVKLAKENKGHGVLFSLCSYCSSPESQTQKHKRC